MDTLAPIGQSLSWFGDGVAGVQLEGSAENTEDKRRQTDFREVVNLSFSFRCLQVRARSCGGGATAVLFLPQTLKREVHGTPAVYQLCIHTGRASIYSVCWDSCRKWRSRER